MFNECLGIRWQCFITRCNTSKFVKYTPLRVKFSTLFSVFHAWYITSSDNVSYVEILQTDLCTFPKRIIGENLIKDQSIIFPSEDHFSNSYNLLSWRCKRLFRERLSEKVHATIPKGIVGGFEFAVLQRNLKEWH